MNIVIPRLVFYGDAVTESYESSVRSCSHPKLVPLPRRLRERRPPTSPPPLPVQAQARLARDLEQQQRANASLQRELDEFRSELAEKERALVECESRVLHAERDKRDAVRQAEQLFLDVASNNILSEISQQNNNNVLLHGSPRAAKRVTFADSPMLVCASTEKLNGAQSNTGESSIALSPPPPEVLNNCWCCYDYS